MKHCPVAHEYPRSPGIAVHHVSLEVGRTIFSASFQSPSSLGRRGNKCKSAVWIRILQAAIEGRRLFVVPIPEEHGSQLFIVLALGHHVGPGGIAVINNNKTKAAQIV